MKKNRENPVQIFTIYYLLKFNVYRDFPFFVVVSCIRFRRSESATKIEVKYKQKADSKYISFKLKFVYFT